ncbi:hypothetical protein, partial [Pseudomonas amygdali]|uniref:hypothetical protein n=1 Tax=Pseudomonas amygdali TaxID=47877 RepID=UPI001F343DA6
SFWLTARVHSRNAVPTLTPKRKLAELMVFLLGKMRRTPPERGVIPRWVSDVFNVHPSAFTSPIVRASGSFANFFWINA